MNITDAVTLSRVKGLGNKSLCSILKTAKTYSIDSIDDLSKNSAVKTSIGARVWKLVDSLVSTPAQVDNLREQCANDLADWRREGIHTFTLGDEWYPEQFLSLPDPPAIIFCKGNIDLLKSTKALAVIGTRDNTPRGKLITERTVQHFVHAGFCIVSGLALGIDAIAHQAAIDNDGKTIAVLVDVQKVSPAQNRNLAEQILVNDGLLISENPPGTPILPALFVKRDRLQAGLALATFAIETSSNGGTMHAVRASLGMGRKVFVPDVESAGYSDKTAQQIEGIQKLIESGEGIPYSKHQYELITTELESFNAQQQQDITSAQGQLL